MLSVIIILYYSLLEYILFSGTAADEHERFIENINVVETVVNPENPLEVYDTDKIGM